MIETACNEASTVTDRAASASVLIPRVVHQMWKTEAVPRRWRTAVASVQKYHCGWQYKLWTDRAMEAYVQRRHVDFYPVFAGFSRQIMRVDVFRYLLMQDFGGLYCDLDYEFLRPFGYAGASVVLSLERDKSYGDDADIVANYVFASVPGHPLWHDVLKDLQQKPPTPRDYYDIGEATGPGLLTRVFAANRAAYHGVVLLPKPVLSPMRVHGRRERKHYRNSGITYGFHHGWGTWKERTSTVYVRNKLGKWFHLRPIRNAHGASSQQGQPPPSSA